MRGSQIAKYSNKKNILVNVIQSSKIYTFQYPFSTPETSNNVEYS